MSATNHNSYIREGYILLYLPLIGLKILHHLLPGSTALYYLMLLMYIICIPGMIFFAGMDISCMLKEKEGFRHKARHKAMVFYAGYMILGIFFETIKHRALFATVKDLIAVLRVDQISNILLTLAVYYLLASWCGEWVERCVKKQPAVVLAIAMAGLAFVVPGRLVGYSQIMLLFGGDCLGVVPVLPYLPALLWGAVCLREGYPGRLQRNLGITAFFVAAGALCTVFHHKDAGFLLAGIGVSALCALVLYLIKPVYEKAEGFVFHCVSRISETVRYLYAKKETSRMADIIWYYLGYTCLFLVAAVMIFSTYMEADRTMIWAVDGLGQYIPKLYRFVNVVPEILKDIFHGREFAQYDFHSGLGSSIVISYDPLYWLNLFVSPAHLETMYSVMEIMRYYLAGAAMSALLLYLRLPHKSVYIGSMMYTYCGYAIYAGSRHAQFISPLFFLPVLFIAMEMIIRDRKWYLMAITVAACVLSSYYFLYMDTIALGIYYVLRIVFDKKYRDIRTFFERGLIIAGTYLLGVCMGCIALVSQIGGYMSSSRTGGGAVKDFLSITPFFYRKEWISDFFIAFLSDSFAPGMWLKLGFAPIAMFCFVLLFTRKNRKELRSMVILFTLFCFIPYAGYVFSGFSSVNNRWSYIYAGIIAVMTALNAEHFDSLTDLELKLMMGLTAVYTGIVYFSTKFRTDKIFGVYGLLVLTLVVILFMNYNRDRRYTRFRKYALFTITMLAIIMNGSLYVANQSEDGAVHIDSFVKKGDAERSIKSTALRFLDQVDGSEDGTFYRSTNQVTFGKQRSSSIVMGYNDLSTFTSTINGNITDYNRMMGNSGWNIVSIYDYNNRTIMNELASVRYLATSSLKPAALPYGYKKVYTKENKKSTLELYENQYALPLGYCYSSVMSEKEAEKYNAAQKQEATLLTAIVDEKEARDSTVSQMTEKTLPLTVKKAKILDVKSVGVTTENGKLFVVPGSYIRIRFRGEPNAETYVSYKGDLCNEKDSAEHFVQMHVKSVDADYMYKFRIDSYSTRQEEYLFNLGYHKKPIYECVLEFTAEGVLSGTEWEIYSQKMDGYEDAVNRLKKNSMTDAKVGKNTVVGHVTADQRELLVITLPFQNGWKAYVDGKETKLVNANYQYMGLWLEPGNHEIRLHYQLPGLKRGFMVCSGAVLLFIVIIIFNFIRKKRTV